MRIFILSFVLSFLTLAAAGRPYYFRHYRNENGLSNNTVVACIQDHRGFVWFGTKEGLNRFDGFQFKVFLHNPSSSNCLISNFITGLCEDRDGWIWIGTDEGLCYYMPDNDRFEVPGKENPDIDGMITDIMCDAGNCIWIATFNGTYRYDKSAGKLNHYPADRYFSPRSINLSLTGEVWLTASDGKIYRYDSREDTFAGYNLLGEEDRSASVHLMDIIDIGNGLIITTDRGGIRKYDPATGKITRLFEDDENLKNLLVRTAWLHSGEEIWLGTESGIHIYNLESGFVRNFRMTGTDPFSLSNNAVRTITGDREGGIWIGTFYGGVNYLPREDKVFEKYYPTGIPGSLNGNVVREIKPDDLGNIWIGTEDAGLFRFDEETLQFEEFSGDRGPVDSRNVQGVTVDHDKLWIGTYDNGIYVMDIRSGMIISHFVNDGRNGLRTNSFITFLKTSDGTIYAGSVSGLYRFREESNSFEYLENVAEGGFIHCLHADRSGKIWIGTYGKGLYVYDISNGTSRKVLSDEGDYEKLEFEYITSIFEDSSGRVWFTTEGSGFSCIDRETGMVKRYIPGKDIEFAIYCAMLQDERGNLWITSTRGLLRFTPDSNKIITYTRDDGLVDNNFSYNSAHRDKSGRMYFGTLRGLVSFIPDEIKESKHNMPVVFTGFQVNGKEFFANEAGNQDFKSILVTDRISLRHNQSSFSIDFVSPSFSGPARIKYRYMMDGADPDWVVIPGNRKVYYTGLSPGKYLFRVRASADGSDWSSDEALMEIRIKPPVWFSMPALFLYFIAASFISYMLISFYRKKNALEQQRRIDLIETGKEKEILNAKIDFFTNITHEVRTPLTLIKGPLDRILKSGLKNMKDNEENLQIIKKNTDRLLSLTNQLLDFRKTEKEMFRLNFVQTDICELAESIFNLFLRYGTEKMISVKLHSPVNHYQIAIDREAVTKILSNLLSNALKFSKSRVDMFLESGTEKDKAFRIRVNSDGDTIPESLSEKIFEPFYQIDFDTPGQKGTGLGLSLAKALAELHHARLYLDEKERNCNSFVLELNKDQEETLESNIEYAEPEQTDDYEFEVFGSFENSRPNLLLVEDEPEMGRFIAKEIADDYNVILTCNGEEAVKALQKFNITLVVSDVVMPVVDGYELCRQIKSNVEYSHIPVILLTATIHLNARIRGLDSGADAYIEKPFSTDLLKAQIENLIKNRSLDRQNFINSPLAHLRSVSTNSTDEEFLTKLNSLLMNNMAENELGVEKIAGMLGLSNSTLYRKIKALTDLNTVEYIRLTRLKKSAELLSEGNYRISEVSYLVGFSSPSYFATSFQKQFGISPSQFIKNLKEMT